MKSGLRVGDAMTVRPVTTTPDMSIRDVAAIMERKHVDSVLVRESDDLMGIVTEWDFVRRAVLDGCNVFTTPIRLIMTKDLVTVSPSMDVFDAILLMKDADIKHLPVIEDGKLIGLVTAKDILRLQPSLFDSFVDGYDLKPQRMFRDKAAVVDIEEFERSL
ncbi:MAG: CBS domain-containing protein [Candidatus Woesearchaeota archaeon]|nr:CBS domain-containing protein [Candidatus Woesearchaeota archaeon]